jgi:hypothetical protein
LPADPEQLGMLLAQQLATAFADGDWDTARRISPLPAWDDQTYEDEFAGLEASTVFLGGTDGSDPNRFVMYLAQVAHESRPEGPQTSFYCVRWDLLIDSSTIDKVAGELLLREPGFTPPADAEGGAWACDGFDQAPSTPVTTPQVNLPSQPMPGTSSSGLGDLTVITFRGVDYVCDQAWRRVGDDLDCKSYFGGDPPFSFLRPDLRCSKASLTGFKCTTEDYYPSELDGYEIAQIGADRVLCRWGQCWIWNTWESPSSATLWPPDYECSGSSCARR